eukprot:Anaeramoba_ignava/a608435_121.p2 GENE.a608435_121~~a608435_121.p2  ORF type:complete len:156 (+),score=66.58 a608435_121:38-505(+)
MSDTSADKGWILILNQDYKQFRKWLQNNDPSQITNYGTPVFFELLRDPPDKKELFPIYYKSISDSIKRNPKVLFAKELISEKTCFLFGCEKGDETMIKTLIEKNPELNTNDRKMQIALKKNQNLSKEKQQELMEFAKQQEKMRNKNSKNSKNPKN